MSGEIDPPNMDTDPIDAQFEPAPPKADFVEPPKQEKKGPGWAALGVTGLLAALVGGGVGATVSGGGNYAPATLVEDVTVIGEGQADIEKALATVAEDVKKTEARLKQQIEATAASGGDAGAIETLSEQLNAINAQLEAIDVAAQEAGEIEAYDYGALEARLDALEALEDDEVASPRLANRAIRSSQRRIEELEAELATRNEALLNLVSRVEAAEAALEADRSAEGRGGEVDEETRAALAANRQAIAKLEETVTALSEREPLTAIDSEEQERLTRWIEELREKEAESRTLIEERGAGQTAIVSLLSIEDAAGNGRGFQTAFAQLEKAMPDNLSVAKLKPLAVNGAATLASLQTDFDAARAETAKLAKASESGQGGNGWGWVQRALGDAVVVRRSGEPEPVETGSVDAVLEAAANSLARRDLEAAIGEIESLDDGLRAPFEAWLKLAKDRQRLDETLDELRLTLMNAGR